MSTTKTAFSEFPVDQFLETIPSERQRIDAQALIGLMRKVSGEEPKMFGSSIIGFGNYHYQYASGHAGNAPLLAFSPRKSAISLYVYTGCEEHLPLVQNLGNYKIGKACIYVKKLNDINLNALEKLMEETVNYISKLYTRIG